jgi:hypothetical protein
MLLIWAPAIGLANAESQKSSYICQAQNYNIATGSSLGPILKLKINFNDLRIKKIVGKKSTEFFGENESCITASGSTGIPSECETRQGAGMFTQEVRCSSKEYQTEYAAQISWMGDTSDFHQGTLVCFVPGFAESYVRWNLTNCRPVVQEL